MPQSSFLFSARENATALLTSLKDGIIAAASSNSGEDFPSRPYAGMPYASTKTGDYYIRNDTNTEWVLVGNLRLDGLGLGDPVGRFVTDVRADLGPKYRRAEGQALSRSDFSELFSIIGVSQGPGDGSTTFNIYDSRGRAIVYPGFGPNNSERTIGEKKGSETTQIDISNMPPHSHPTVPTGLRVDTIGSVTTFALGKVKQSGTDSTQTVGSGQPFDIMNPYGPLAEIRVILPTSS